MSNLISNFINADCKQSSVEEISREKLPANFRSTIAKAIAMQTSDDKPCYCRLNFKTGGFKNISLVAPTCFFVKAGDQFDIKSLQFVITKSGDDEYLNIDGELK